jgi:hypothetical protein
MERLVDALNSALSYPNLQPAAPYILLAIIQLLLLGPILMPVLIAFARAFLMLARFAIRRVRNYVIDRIIETIIFLLAAVFGGLVYAG